MYVYVYKILYNMIEIIINIYIHTRLYPTYRIHVLYMGDIVWAGCIHMSQLSGQEPHPNMKHIHSLGPNYVEIPD